MGNDNKIPLEKPVRVKENHTNHGKKYHYNSSIMKDSDSFVLVRKSLSRYYVYSGIGFMNRLAEVVITDKGFGVVEGSKYSIDTLPKELEEFLIWFHESGAYKDTCYQDYYSHYSYKHDVSICNISTSSVELRYSGAMNRLYFVSDLDGYTSPCYIDAVYEDGLNLTPQHNEYMPFMYDVYSIVSKYSELVDILLYGDAGTVYEDDEIIKEWLGKKDVIARLFVRKGELYIAYGHCKNLARVKYDSKNMWFEMCRVRVPEKYYSTIREYINNRFKWG